MLLVKNSEDPDLSPGPFGVLQVAEGEFTPEMEAVVASSGSDATAENIGAWGQAETVPGTEVTVFEYEDDVCLVDETRGTKMCGNTSRAQRGELFFAEPVACDRVRVVGLVPDGTGKVMLEQEGRAGATVPVVSNLYEAELPAVDTVLSDGTEETQVELPLKPFVRELPRCVGSEP